MTRATCSLFAACALAAAAPAADPPAKAPSDTDKLMVDVLRDVHNRGAELYNRGDPAGCYRMYEGALLTARAFLAHRPTVQKLIDDGLAEVSQSPNGVKYQAFRLHEVIELVRGELKRAPGTAPASQPTPKSTTPTPMPPTPTPKSAPTAAKGGQVSGKVVLDGQPLAGAEVTVVTLALPLPLTFSATTKADGTYAFADPLPPGKYAVIVTGGKGVKVPEKYQTTDTSGLSYTIVAGPQMLNLDLKSK